MKRIVKSFAVIVLATSAYNPFQVTDPLHFVTDSILPLINQRLASLGATSKNVLLADTFSAFSDSQAS